MQTSTAESAIYATMFNSMQEMGAINIHVSDPAKMIELGIKSAKSKGIEKRDPVDNLMLLAYYRAMRLALPDHGTEWHGGREGAIISRLLYQKEEIVNSMADFLLSTRVSTS